MSIGACRAIHPAARLGPEGRQRITGSAAARLLQHRGEQVVRAARPRHDPESRHCRIQREHTLDDRQPGAQILTARIDQHGAGERRACIGRPVAARASTSAR